MKLAAHFPKIKMRRLFTIVENNPQIPPQCASRKIPADFEKDRHCRCIVIGPRRADGRIVMRPDDQRGLPRSRAAQIHLQIHRRPSHHREWLIRHDMPHRRQFPSKINPRRFQRMGPQRIPLSDQFGEYIDVLS
jgi:hypothetical protein